ncbi:MAG: hypothetical protein MZV64_52525 [Ignavibacteriales bacterium]|nr:hypothetical protein [Ignavibacteriales bacterium]
MIVIKVSVISKLFTPVIITADDKIKTKLREVKIQRILFSITSDSNLDGIWHEFVAVKVIKSEEFAKQSESGKY